MSDDLCHRHYCQNIFHRTTWNRTGQLIRLIEGGLGGPSTKGSLSNESSADPNLATSGLKLASWNLKCLKRYSLVEKRFSRLGSSIATNYLTYISLWLLIFAPLTLVFFMKEWKISEFSTLWIYDPVWPFGGTDKTTPPTANPLGDALSDTVYEARASGTVSQHSIIQTWPSDRIRKIVSGDDGYGDDSSVLVRENFTQLDRFKLLQHLRVVTLATAIQIEVHDTKWSLRDICYRPTIPKMEYLSQKLADNLLPCSIITPLDCFWDGSKIHKHAIGILPLPNGKNIDLSLETLDPGQMVRDIESSGLPVNLKPLVDFMERADITSGYGTRECLNYKDPKCPNKQNKSLNLDALLHQGCRGLSARFARWPKELIVDHKDFGEEAEEDKILALQTTIQLMSEQDLFEYWDSTPKVSSLAYNHWTVAAARDILQAWQQKFQQLVSQAPVPSVNGDLYRLLEVSRDQNLKALAHENRVQVYGDVLAQAKVYPLAENTFERERKALGWPFQRIFIMMCATIIYLILVLRFMLHNLSDCLVYVILGVFINSTTIFAGLGALNLLKIQINLMHYEIVPFLVFAYGLESIVFMASKLSFTITASKNGSTDATESHLTQRQGIISCWLAANGSSFVPIFLSKLVGLLCLLLIPIKGLRILGCSIILITTINQLSILILVPASFWVYYKRRRMNDGIEERSRSLSTYPDLLPQQNLHKFTTGKRGCRVGDCNESRELYLVCGSTDVPTAPDGTSTGTTDLWKGSEDCDNHFQIPRIDNCCFGPKNGNVRGVGGSQKLYLKLTKPSWYSGHVTRAFLRPTQALRGLEGEVASQRLGYGSSPRLGKCAILTLLIFVGLLAFALCALVIPATARPKAESNHYEGDRDGNYNYGYEVNSQYSLDLSLFYPRTGPSYITGVIRNRHFDVQQIYALLSDRPSDSGIASPKHFPTNGANGPGRSSAAPFTLAQVSYPHGQEELYTFCRALSHLPNVVSYESISKRSPPKEFVRIGDPKNGIGGGDKVGAGNFSRRHLDLGQAGGEAENGCDGITFWLQSFRDWLMGLQDAYLSDLKSHNIRLNDRLEAIVHINSSNDGILGHALMHQTHRLFGNRGEYGLYPLTQDDASNKLTFLVDREGIINPQGFYYYLTAWASNDPMFYYESQANFLPLPQKWIFDPHEMEFNVPKSKKLLSTTIPLYAKDLNLRSSSGLRAISGMVKQASSPYATIPNDRDLLSSRRQFNVPYTFVGLPFALYDHFIYFAKWNALVISLYLALQTITSLTLYSTAYTLLLGLCTGLLNVTVTLALTTVPSVRDLFSKLINIDSRNSLDSGITRGSAVGLNHYQIFATLLVTVTMSYPYIHVLQVFPTIIGDRVRRIRTLYTLLIPPLFATLGGYLICLFCMKYSNYDLVSKLFSKAFFINTVLTHVTVVTLYPIILCLLPHKAIVTLGGEESHLVIIQCHEKPVHNPPSNSRQTRPPTTILDRIPPGVRRDYIERGHCPFQNGGSHATCMYGDSGHGRTSYEQRSTTPHTAKKRSHHHSYEKRRPGFVYSDNSLSTISEESPSLLTNSEDSISIEPSVVCHHTVQANNFNVQAASENGSDFKGVKINSTDHPESSNDNLISTIQSKSKQSITTITAKATIVIKNL